MSSGRPTLRQCDRQVGPPDDELPHAAQPLVHGELFSKYSQCLVQLVHGQLFLSPDAWRLVQLATCLQNVGD